MQKSKISRRQAVDQPGQMQTARFAVVFTLLTWLLRKLSVERIGLFRPGLHRAPELFVGLRAHLQLEPAAFLYLFVGQIAPLQRLAIQLG